MAYLLTEWTEWYHDLMDNRSDPRVNDWAMMSSPLPTLGLCIFYAYFSKVLGPRIMKSRQPFSLRKILIVYNFFQTIFSAWIFYEYLMSGWWGHYSFKCQPVDYSRSPLAMRMANICWWYYISKFTEFFDTLFFILRNKMQQVSTLHVIHHGCMPFSVWMGLKFAPGGHSTFFAMLNSFVHIVMYFYYMVSAMGPEYQKYIWWKKYLTTFQMVQFVAIFTHQFQLLLRPDCDYPKGFMVWIGLHGIMFLFLFSDFYKAKYRSVKKGMADKRARNGAVQTGNGVAGGVTQNGNQGACMPVMNDEELKTEVKLANGFHKNGSVKTNGYAKHSNDITSNGSLLNGKGDHHEDNGKKRL